MLIVAIVVAVIVIAAISVWAIIYLGTGSLAVNTTNPFVAAKSSTDFRAVITTPALVSAGAVDWKFGDGSSTSGAAASVNHTYDFPGTFFIYASSALSNGKAVDNSMALLPLQVGPVPVPIANPLGETSAPGSLTINRSGSAAGAPLIATGGSILFRASVSLAPDFAWSNEVNVATNEWYNYSWAITSLSVNFGDGSAPSINASTPFTDAVGYPYLVSHQYNTAGLFVATLTVTTQNYSFHQVDGVPANPAATPVSPAQTQITKVGQSVAVGSYQLVSYSGNVVNPGTIVNMEQSSGGTWTLDPSINYIGSEPIINIYQTLLGYNYTSTTDLVPIIADSIPTVASGEISSDYMNYTFHIRPGLKFSDGTPVTAWDVKYSITRSLLFANGAPPTPGWLLSQFLDPDYTANYTVLYPAVEANNATQDVTFHLSVAAPPTVFFEVLTSTLGAGIVSHTWLEQVGPPLVWSEAGFDAYAQYGNLQNWVSAWRNGAVGSGPYMIDYVANPDAIVLKVNPDFTPVPGVPAPSVGKVVIQYVADDSTRELSLQTGKADIAAISSSRYAVAANLAQQGLIHILPIPTMTMYWWNFNMEIYQSGTPSNPYGNSVPPDFFVDLNMRKAFFYAFNFQQYIDQILGNGVYNTKFGALYNGIIPEGMPGYVNYSYLATYDMAKAHQFYNATQWVKDKGWTTSGFTLALNVGQEDPIASAAAAMWAQSLQQLAPAGQIHINIVPITDAEVTADAVPHANPMGVYSVGFGWAPDYPWPTDYTVPMLLPGLTLDEPYGGYYTATNGFNIEYFQNDANGTGQVANMTKMYNWIDDSLYANSTNPDQAIWDSQQANWMGMNETLYVPEFQLYNHVYYRTWITGMDLEANPLNGGQWLLYAYLSKPGGVATSSVPSGMSALASVVAAAFAGPALVAIVDSRGTWNGTRRKEG
jgi:ABC-type transport system substrate-binding protein